ncbi:biosynthetic peptidoglycan transglycosylase [Modestobacter sp. VKM Ac-2984]|uniref:biosynthetic peptidoglycan transglycosylase n=1 Tax=Modestobacter sp. VKM Ac-2984 TaxID=3004138 RepID=UPI0022AAFF34|nr:biosynthetic peptidoglycan transglycosylase [Modestobacter sp. VKM Ac-2984]MCZ2818621.1 transglycosylase domain-containing protein [Modestobacter sp. VKM Ac-2984]
MLALVVAGLLFLVAAWQLTPDVDDARDRVDARLAAAAAPALSGPLPGRLSAAVLATEDSHFHGHPGVDPRGVVRAARGALTGVDLGGSTLHQQLAKNLYENGANGFTDRVSAVVLALKLDRAWSEEEVLRMYLDDAYFGHGFTGATAAAQGYFGVPPGELDWAQAALLAGLLQAPSAYDPVQHPDRAAARQEHVLDRLVDVGALTRAQADEVAADPWGLVAG